MSSPESIAPGVWRYRFGTPEEASPVALRRTDPALDRMAGLSPVEECPFARADFSFRTERRGCVLTAPFAADEGVFGFGLQLQSHLQSGKKKHLRVNSDPVADTGDSHAPVPFYVSTRGYGVLVDTARYASVYVGTHLSAEALKERAEQRLGQQQPGLSTEEIYRRHAFGREVVFDIPAAAGVDVYVFAGPTMKDAIRRYVLFSGGGCLPPLWGLKNWYRPFAKDGAAEVGALLEEFAKDGLPFHVLGLEPGWQTRSYPNSLVWSDRFPDPEAFAGMLRSRHWHLNLWEHAFLDPASPIAGEIASHSADTLGMDGLVPDFFDPEAERLFAGEHRRLVKGGVAGFKLDECDNSDFISYSWSFPEHARFPSGLDGEQMHCLYGLAYQATVDRVFREEGQRHYSLVRSSGALAAPFPFALYSDLYAHDEFLRGMINSGFSGHLFAPEVRHAASVEDLVRRLQTAVLSPVSQVNCWYMPHAPWFQIDRQLNQAGVKMEGAGEVVKLVKQALELRMRLLPLLYTAFAQYHREGVPPFRALVVDTPEDRRTWTCDQQYLIGRSLLAAPLKAGERVKEVYLPQGVWRDFFTGKRLEGGRTHTLSDLSLADIPLFVREGTVLPLAEGAEGWFGGGPLTVRLHVYGDEEAEGELYADDGETFAFERGDCSWTRFTWTATGGLKADGHPAGDLFLLNLTNPVLHASSAPASDLS